jgi:hypothetical protein
MQIFPPIEFEQVRMIVIELFFFTDSIVISRHKANQMYIVNNASDSNEFQFNNIAECS